MALEAVYLENATYALSAWYRGSRGQGNLFRLGGTLKPVGNCLKAS